MNLAQIRMLVVAAVLFILLDLAYMRLNFSMLSRQLIDVQGTTIRPKQIGFFLSYVFLIGGLYWFILREQRSVRCAMLLGLVIYGVYESTNYGLFTQWRAMTAIIDTLWGSALFGFTTAAIYALKAKQLV